MHFRRQVSPSTTDHPGAQQHEEHLGYTKLALPLSCPLTLRIRAGPFKWALLRPPLGQTCLIRIHFELRVRTRSPLFLSTGP